MILDDIIAAIEKFNTIIIHRHARPDPDAFGSQGGLQAIIKASYPEKQILMTGENEPSLSFLSEMDIFDDTVYQNALVIVCDTANMERIDGDHYDRGKMLIKIDHHPDVEHYGDLQWVDTAASSTSEMIYALYLHGKDSGLQMDNKAARLLYAGIVGDTGRFMYSNTTKQTMAFGSELITYNFDRQQLFNHLYEMKPEIARLKGYILQNYTIYDSGLCTIRLTKKIMAQFDVDANQSSQTVSTLGELQGVVSWVMFVEEDEQIRARLRSKGPAINDIAGEFHGGGHPMASGATVYDWDEANRLCKRLDDRCMAYN